LCRKKGTMMLPEKHPPATPGKMSPFGRAVARLRERLKAQEIARLPARFTMQRCAVTGQRQMTEWRREAPEGPFRVLQISVIEEWQDGAGNLPGKARPSERPTMFNAWEFHWPSLYCKCCGRRGIFIQCPRCKELVCTGKAKFYKRGGGYFYCHEACGGRCEFGGGSITTLPGTEGTARPVPALPPGKPQKAPPPGRKLIGRTPRNE
jgi:hypothetical protein